MIGVPIGTTGAVPRTVKMSRAALAAAGFEGACGQTLFVPGASTPMIAVGIGDPAKVDADALRAAAAGLVRAARGFESVATSLADNESVGAAVAGRAVAEGVILGGYTFDTYKSKPRPVLLQRVTLTAAAPRRAALERAVEVGVTVASAGVIARDLVNTPAADLPARKIAERAVELGAEFGFDVEVFNKDQLAAMGCGGLLGVNAGSTEPPRLVKLSYRPRHPKGHLALVGKGVMFDSGGLSLKPSDGMMAMKMDMSGAAAVLAAMTTLRRRRCAASVTGFLVCTDNMPSGSSMKLGDVLRFRNGKTAEILNTDAEGRLALADGLSLAAEEEPDAIVDIATLTGACMVALGTRYAGVMGTSPGLIDQLREASAATGERVWELPLDDSYRKLLDSVIADMKNVGGPYGGAITAGVFLREFVGDVPWAHLDIAGPMGSEGDIGWVCKGATGFGARLLAELAVSFTAPAKAATAAR